MRARGKGGGVKVVLVGTSKLETALEESSGCEMRIEREGERFIERERERCIERVRERCTDDERVLNIEEDLSTQRCEMRIEREREGCIESEREREGERVRVWVRGEMSRMYTSQALPL